MWPFQRRLPGSNSPEWPAITELGEALKRLRAMDTGCKVFGASMHRYASIPVSARDMEHLEEALGVGLPAEFRQFLLEIGYGAGPYYGLWSPSAILAEFTGLREEYDRVRAANPFPWTLEDLRAIAARVAGGAVDPWGTAQSLLDCGYILIGHQGCMFHTALVTSGGLTGTVLDTLDELEMHGLPARRPSGFASAVRELVRLPSPSTFVEWYRSWLEQCFSDLEVG